MQQSTDISKITFSINKVENFPEWYEEIVKIADIVDNRYPVQAMMVWKPYGYKALKLMLNIMDNILEEYGHEEASFPSLIPESIFGKESDFLKGFGGAAFTVTLAGDSQLTEKLFLRPTSETVMYEMFKLWIRSKSDLPLKIYQTVNVFRYETKQTKAILRVREIIKFKEAHTAHSTPEEADQQIKEGIEIYKQFFDILSIPYIIVKTTKWDTFAGAEYNYDFISVMPDGKGIELGSVINLGNKFSKAYGIEYQKDDSSFDYVYQTCYGMSERALGVAFSIHGDNKGLIIPPIIAPIQIIIIPILYKGKEDLVLQQCNNIKNLLINSGFRVKFDDRNKGPGDKFYFWEAKGVPLRLEIGPKDIESNQVVVVRRDNSQKLFLKVDIIIDNINAIFNDLNTELLQRGKTYLSERILYFKTIEEMRTKYKERSGLVALPWCKDEYCGIELEKQIAIPSIGYDPEKVIDFQCPICNKKGNITWLYFGRTY